MTVAELIAKLKDMPQDAQVKVHEVEVDDYVDVTAVNVNAEGDILLDTDWAV